MGLVVATSRTEPDPEVTKADLHCAALDTNVLAGRVMGFTDTDIVETTNGIGLTLKMTGKVYGPGESDSNEWTVVGEPSLNLVNTELPTHLTTCATLVNRLPDVIAALPGYLTPHMLLRLTYRP